MPTFRVRAAMRATPTDLAPDLPRTLPTSGQPAMLQLVTAEQLSARSRDAIYTLYDDNMRLVSAGSSVTYTESDKRQELFDPDTRFLLVTRSLPDSWAMPGALPPTKKGKSKLREVDFGKDEVLGYTSFRFDTEETLGDRDAEVIYCYELQLAESARGQGLGAVLMDTLEQIGRERSMSKSMLTCLKANEHALAFYAKQGYIPDEIDPTRMAEEESEEEWEEVGSNGEPLDKPPEAPVDYVILSKNLQSL